MGERPGLRQGLPRLVTRLGGIQYGVYFFQQCRGGERLGMADSGKTWAPKRSACAPAAAAQLPRWIETGRSPERKFRHEGPRVDTSADGRGRLAGQVVPEDQRLHVHPPPPGAGVASNPRTMGA